MRLPGLPGDAAMDRDLARLLSRILTLYYETDHSQAEIAELLGLSTPKVNRLLQQARRDGLVETRLHIPYQNLFDLERRLQELTSLCETVVVPADGSSDEVVLRIAGHAAANLLLATLRDGDVLAMGGGTTLYQLVEALAPARPYRVTVVPALGGVQGRFATDVNRLASAMAERLGGHALQMLAPAIVDSVEEHQALCSLRQIRDVLEAARNAAALVMGIGTLGPEASYFLFAGTRPEEIERHLQENRGVGEVLAHVIDVDGQCCADWDSGYVVGLTLEEIHVIPVRIGVAASVRKAPAIAAALRAGHLTALVTDELAAKEVIRILETT
jgi:DNA-binding transcriptional regulator LsrR (DeoR family)